MSKSKTSFEKQYLVTTWFVKTLGWIEIGDHEMIPAFVRACDLGGTVYEGESSYSSMEEASQDLEEGIKAYLDENGIEYSSE